MKQTKIHAKEENTSVFAEIKVFFFSIIRSVNSPHPQGLQGSHLNLSQISAQRHRTYFLVNNKAVNCDSVGGHRPPPPPEAGRCQTKNLKELRNVL